MRSFGRQIPRLASPEVDECDDVDERARNKELALELEDQVLCQSPLISPSSAGGGAPFLLTPSPSLSPSSSSLKISFPNFRRARNAKISCTCQGCTLQVSRRRTCREPIHTRPIAMLPLSQSFSGRFESLSPYGGCDSSSLHGSESPPATPGSGRWSNGLSKSPWQRFPAMLHNNLGRYLFHNSFTEDKERNLISDQGRSDSVEYRNCSTITDDEIEGQNVTRSVSYDASLSGGLANLLLLKVIGSFWVGNCVY